MNVAELIDFLDSFNKKAFVLVDPMDWRDDPVYVLGVGDVHHEDGSPYVRFVTQENSKLNGDEQPLTVASLKDRLEDYPKDMSVEIEVLDVDGVYVKQMDIDPEPDHLGFDLYLEIHKQEQ